jgi:very-short-patch-repair endonuclease
MHRLAGAQGGHVTRAQLLALGMPPRTFDDWVADRRLIRVYHGVYAVGHLQRNPLNRAHAALLAGGRRSALSGASALVIYGIWKRWPTPIEVVIGENRRPARLTVHHSRTLIRRDVRTVQGLRVTSPARTLLDTAPRLSSKQLTRAVNDLRLRKLLSIDAIEDVVARNANHRAVTLLRPHLEHAQPEPTRSFLEDEFLPLLRLHRLPTPQINVKIAGHRVDAYFPDHNLIVELDGWGPHRTRHAFVGDRHQDAEILARTGIPTVRLPHEDVAANATSFGRLVELLRAPAPRRAAVYRPVRPGATIDI